MERIKKMKLFDPNKIEAIKNTNFQERVANAIIAEEPHVELLKIQTHYLIQATNYIHQIEIHDRMALANILTFQRSRTETELEKAELKLQQKFEELSEIEDISENNAIKIKDLLDNKNDIVIGLRLKELFNMSLLGTYNDDASILMNKEKAEKEVEAEEFYYLEKKIGPDKKTQLVITF